MAVPHTPAAAPHSVAHRIAVQRFRADQVFTDNRILFRHDHNQVSHYEYHRWASPPQELVTNSFIHCLKDSGSYAKISAYKEGPDADFILQGRIHHFEEVDRGKEVLAAVELEVELVNGKTRRSVWRSKAECSKPLATRDLAGVTQGIHACLEETAGKLLGEIQTQVAKSGRQ
jgi:ABC-type uncharacterized transport system auxiliary subunit